MHEYSLVQALLQRVEEEARSRRASAVHRITVRIGPLAGVERALFATAYDFCRSGTLCDTAELVLTGEDVDWRCTACGAQIPDGTRLACPECGWPARLEGGDALILERIDLEVPQDV
ncbi:MAG TPA: hydrogenase maturation nickel metallochaperone HypA [Candidatus Acidoferrales bacterium]|jgi:hydrogenase nickel incorporation protein HypA/HybF|nr:hydrogenase maturation nickel metallochaperone HypA [Candidatus Acidoferrales bacterium]